MSRRGTASDGQLPLPLDREVPGDEPWLGHGEQTLRWKDKSRTESFRSLRRTAVFVTRMYGGVPGKAGDRLPMSISRTAIGGRDDSSSD